MRPGTPIMFVDDSITFACGFQGALGDDQKKTYPRSTDPVSGRWLFINNVTETSFKIQVLDSVPSTNTDSHTWVTASINGIIEGDPLVAPSGSC